MIIDILKHTPAWVWVLLAALLGLGLAQTRARALSLTRITVLPMALLLLSVSGAYGAFGITGLAGWCTGLALGLVIAARAAFARGARWSAESGRILVPGSWLPLALIIGIFFMRYGVGVALALQPRLAADAGFSAACTLAYGIFSGVIAGRAYALRKLARPGGAMRTA
jgi:hypothetical protein